MLHKKCKKALLGIMLQKKQVNIVIIDIRILCQGIASNTSSLKDTTKFF